MPVLVSHQTDEGSAGPPRIVSMPVILSPGFGDGENPSVFVPPTADLISGVTNHVINADKGLVDSGLSGQVIEPGAGRQALPNLGNVADPHGQVETLKSIHAKAQHIDESKFRAFCGTVRQLPLDSSSAATQKHLVGHGFSQRERSRLFSGAMTAGSRELQLAMLIARHEEAGKPVPQVIEAALNEATAIVTQRRTSLANLIKPIQPLLDQCAVFQRITGEKVKPLIIGTGKMDVQDFVGIHSAFLEKVIADEGIDDVAIAGQGVEDLSGINDLVSGFSRHVNVWPEVQGDPTTVASQLGKPSNAEAQSRIIPCVGCGDGTAALALLGHRLNEDRQLFCSGSPTDDRLGLFEPQEAHEVFGLSGSEEFVLKVGLTQQQAFAAAQVNALVMTQSGVHATPLMTRCGRADLSAAVPVRASGIGQAWVASVLGTKWLGKYLYQQQLDAGVEAAMNLFMPYNQSKIISVKAQARRSQNSGEVIFLVEYLVPHVIKHVVLRRKIILN